MSTPDMKSVEPKINKAQFARAVQEGYYDSRCSDPMIRYSAARGFHVESKQHPADDDVIWSLQCLRSADDGKPHGLPSVEEVKAEILEEMKEKKKTDLEWAADLIQMTVLRRSDMNNLVNKRWRREHGLR